MKFLISNYSSYWNTEALYLNGSLNTVEDNISAIYDPNKSAYDNFDIVKPDIFITHFTHLSRDIVSYIKDTKIKLVICLSGIEEKDASKVKEVVDSLESNGIIASYYGYVSWASQYKFKFLNLLPAADIFVNRTKANFKIDKLIFIDSEDQLVEQDGTYHFTTTVPELHNKVDFVLPIFGLNSIFKCYDQIVFSKSYIGSQVSFDAIYSDVKTIFDVQKDTDLLSNIFKGEKFLSSVKKKHTCLNRTKSLMSFLSCNDLVQKIENKIGEI
jgi:hypothetical protein